MNRSDVLSLLRDQIAIAGSQRQFAIKHKITTGYLNDVLQKRKPPGPMILKAINIEMIETYRSTIDVVSEFVSEKPLRIKMNGKKWYGISSVELIVHPKNSSGTLVYTGETSGWIKG